jgi:hypothetical protein
MICPSCCHNNLPGDEVCRHCQQSLTSFDLPQPENHLERSVMYDLVKSLKQNAPVIIGPAATIRAAMDVMVRSNVGALLIVDGQGQLVGIFSRVPNAFRRTTRSILSYKRGTRGATVMSRSWTRESRSASSRHATCCASSRGCARMREDRAGHDARLCSSLVSVSWGFCLARSRSASLRSTSTAIGICAFTAARV